jgi:acyl-coenzyme A synthetase/AMP-(fatty) acid ligase
VIGIPDHVKGHIPKAYIVLESGASCTKEEIIRFSKSCMAAYKAPREVEFVKLTDLPQTASGKVLKRELRAREEAKAKLG